MRIVIQAPRTSEAKSAYNRDDGLAIEPRFFMRKSAATGCFLTVLDNDGNEVERYMIQVNGRNATLRLWRLKEVQCDFDAKRGISKPIKEPT